MSCINQISTNYLNKSDNQTSNSNTQEIERDYP